MKKIITLLFCLFPSFVFTQSVNDSHYILEPFTYSENFETRELSAWASYPTWQDAAYDEKTCVANIISGDPNISFEQKVIPYSNVDNYAGAQKKLDMYMIPGSGISLRYYLKTHLKVEYFKVRLAAGKNGKADFTVMAPPTNQWEWLIVTYEDIVRENPQLSGKNIKVNALAVLAKIPHADPAMPIYLGLDDIVFKGARTVHFQFIEPEMYKLSEWKSYIPKKHYKKNDEFTLSGRLPFQVDRVSVRIVPFTNRTEILGEHYLIRENDTWFFKIKLPYPEGMYLATLSAYRGEIKVSETEFTIYIAPENIGGNHPRLWFDDAGEKRIKTLLQNERFAQLKETILAYAKESRVNLPVESLIFDIDQFPEDDWLPTLGGWINRISVWRNGIYYNSLAYKLLGDSEAGVYAKSLFLQLCRFPTWLHPWMKKRGRHIYYPIGELGMDMAIGFDLIYDILNEDERNVIRSALMKNIIQGAHKSYVEDDLVTCNSSNWVAHITGGSLMCQAVMYGDDPNYQDMEPYFTGAIVKDYGLIQTVIDRDGAYGEGYGYYNFSMLSWSKSLPAVENVFKIDLSNKIHRSYLELIWAGMIKEKKFFYFGDSNGDLGPITNWAWLLPKYKDPLLGWLYNFLKKDETFMDVLYETKDVPQQNPFNENPVKVFRDVGTTVFKSGWEKDDFVFVMRTGPFINHQHLDQGSFWLADKGTPFIEERKGETYYEQMLYQSQYIQPIAHSTILIDNNLQSQRTGDPLVFAEGFDDYAFINHFLDGKNSAFSSGDIGRLYWGKIKEMTRNVLYIKPGTLLMLDVITPAERDVDVSLLYQTHYLNDITANQKVSTITKGDNTLHILHVAPDNLDIKAREIPHFYYTLLHEKQLIKEGCLSITARTTGKPLVMANILTTSKDEKPDITIYQDNGFFNGTVNGVLYAFTTKPGMIYATAGLTTDALAVTGDNFYIFVALCTSLKKDGNMLIKSKLPLTCEISENKIKYYHCMQEEVFIGARNKPEIIIINGKQINDFVYDTVNNGINVVLPAGEGMVEIK